MKSFLSLQKFQDDDIQVWVINCQQRKEQLFSRKIHSGARNRPSPASVDWGSLRRFRAYRVNELGLIDSVLWQKNPELAILCQRRNNKQNHANERYTFLKLMF
ncbi:hypothetical protein AVEN_123463-1 [Araneus ventricosus]|uniref:Uncharacterized protein n=1 Tax=Araneus ventricosus TaxID=182803 RepID=A0A4Y2MAY4_ARAVE|nr:hypothetical protein AVEN_123463-1 [Araneus ventricosus]